MPYRLSTDYKIHDRGMTSNDHFCVKFHYTNRVSAVKLIFTAESLYTRDQRRCAVWKRTVVRRIFGIREKKLRIFRRHCVTHRNLNK